MGYILPKTNRIWLGVIIGVVAPWVVIPILIYIVPVIQNLSPEQVWYDFFHTKTTMSRLLSLSLIGNLLWFYLVINRHQYGIARGVILGTLIYFPLFVYLIYS
jgi:hypothetical protein